MAFVKCPQCGTKITIKSFGLIECPNCGRVMKTADKNAKASQPATPKQDDPPLSLLFPEKPKEPTKKCKHCMSDIPINANVCPHCRRKQKGGVLKWVILGTAGTVMFLFVALAAIGLAVDSASELSSAQAETEAKEESSNATEEPKEIEEEKDDGNPKVEDVEVLAEYTLPDSISWYTRRFRVIRNNSNKTVDISTSSLAYSADGTMVAAADSYFDALGSGCTSVYYEAFETGEAIDHYETNMNVSKSTYYESVIQDLSYVQNGVENGAIFQVTNNGGRAAQFVEGYALFFLGDSLVGYESTYFTDDDSELKPGTTISKQLTSYEPFDRVEFYLTGRR